MGASSRTPVPSCWNHGQCHRTATEQHPQSQCERLGQTPAFPQLPPQSWFQARAANVQNVAQVFASKGTQEEVNPDCFHDIQVSPNQKEPIPDGGEGESTALSTPCVFFIETFQNPNSRTRSTCPSLTSGTRRPGRTTLVPTPASARRLDVSSTLQGWSEGLPGRSYG